MADGNSCINCGYMEAHHEENARQYYGKTKKGYDYSAETCPGFECDNQY